MIEEIFTTTDDDGTYVESVTAAMSPRDLMDDLITCENHLNGTREAVAWIESLGLDPSRIPKTGWVIDPKAMRLYWREFKLDTEGNRVLRDGAGYVRTRTKSMPLDSIPDFLN